MRKKVLLLLIIMMMVTVACSKDKDQGTEKEPKKPVEEVEEMSVAPFTGLETDEDITNRAVAVMINNQSQARPHLGLVQADIVFELLAEGDITRFLALYHSEQPEVVGSIRSAREYYFELANGYDALYIYHGAAKFVNEMIKSRGIDYLDGAFYDNDNYLFKRESFRRAPHNSFLLFDSVYEEATVKGYDIEHNYEPLLFIDENDDIDGEPASEIKINYAINGTDVVTYNYDEAIEKYTRQQNADPTVDLNSNEQIEIDNVFVVETYHEIFDNEGRRKIDIESGGNAYLFQKGTMQHVQWINDNGRIVPVKDGETIGFVPGKTWINFVPTNPSIEQSVTIE